MATIYRGARYEDLSLKSKYDITMVRLFNPTTKEYAEMTNFKTTQLTLPDGQILIQTCWYLSEEQTLVLTAGSYTLEIYGNPESGEGLIMLSSFANFAKVTDSSMPYSK